MRVKGDMFRCTRSTDPLPAKPPKTFNREEAADFRRQHILAVASRLFGRYGIEGATTGTLCHYVDGKEDLVIRCYRRASTVSPISLCAMEGMGWSQLLLAVTSIHRLK